MMIPKKRMDGLILIAIDVLRNSNIKDTIEDVEVINETFHGYVSSFGAMMAISSPLAAALMFESNSGEGQRTKENRSLVPKALLDLMRKELTSAVVPDNFSKLSDYLINIMKNNNRLSRAAKLDLTASCVALKMAMRSFPKSSSKA